MDATAPHSRSSSPPAPYPLPPWTLEGEGYLSVALVPTDTARPTVPAGIDIVTVQPGLTAGGLWLARYGGPSTLCYSELICFSALARAGGAVGVWVSSVYVDNAASVAGGRAIWGLPKELAEFEWAAGEVRVERGGGALCVLKLPEAGAPGRLALPTPLLVPAISVVGGKPVFFQGRGSSAMRLERASWWGPPGSPVHLLGLVGERRVLRHDGLRLSVTAPATIG